MHSFLFGLWLGCLANWPFEELQLDAESQIKGSPPASNGLCPLETILGLTYAQCENILRQIEYQQSLFLIGAPNSFMDLRAYFFDLYSLASLVANILESASPDCR